MAWRGVDYTMKIYKNPWVYAPGKTISGRRRTMGGMSKDLWSGVLAVILLMAFTSLSWAADAPRISKEELKGMLGKENLVIIDVRTDIDLEKSKQKIPGARIEDPGKVETWMDKYPKEKTLVIYCA
jgi:hypothetical protein